MPANGIPAVSVEISIALEYREGAYLSYFARECYSWVRPRQELLMIGIGCAQVRSSPCTDSSSCDK